MVNLMCTRIVKLLYDYDQSGFYDMIALDDMRHERSVSNFVSLSFPEARGRLHEQRGQRGTVSDLSAAGRQKRLSEATHRRVPGWMLVERCIKARGLRIQKSELNYMYPTLRMEKDDSSDEDYIVDTEDSEDDEVISGDTDDPLILGHNARAVNAKDKKLRRNLSYGKKRRQSPHQLFVNRRYSSHEPVPSNKKLKVMVDEGPKAQSDE
ncbi:hypothetical protein GN244_ATG14168 [Phytophthora infestans]|uniref:Uncharacterized protein n=1 Tax=Phytophthora infestans TaxID=4787 RepID=A0A833SYJ5_PHYIN|nr:hypothetical protein GN244_ATG14168 [Phytophthora infestans]